MHRGDGPDDDDSCFGEGCDANARDLDPAGDFCRLPVPARGAVDFDPDGCGAGLSLLGTFAVMYLLGYTLDNLSLMALTISTGFVVDDAIVVIENITRHLEARDDAFSRRRWWVRRRSALRWCR